MPRTHGEHRSLRRLMRRGRATDGAPLAPGPKARYGRESLTSVILQWGYSAAVTLFSGRLASPWRREGQVRCHARRPPPEFHEADAREPPTARLAIP